MQGYEHEQVPSCTSITVERIRGKEELLVGITVVRRDFEAYLDVLLDVSAGQVIVL